MSQFQQLDQLMERQDGMLRTGQVLAAGISKPVFYQFVQSRGLEQAAHGIYLSKDAWVDAMYLLLWLFPLSHSRLYCGHWEKPLNCSILSVQPLAVYSCLPFILCSKFPDITNLVP